MKRIVGLFLLGVMTLGSLLPIGAGAATYKEEKDAVASLLREDLFCHRFQEDGRTFSRGLRLYTKDYTLTFKNQENDKIRKLLVEATEEVKLWNTSGLGLFEESVKNLSIRPVADGSEASFSVFFWSDDLSREVEAERRVNDALLRFSQATRGLSSRGKMKTFHDHLKKTTRYSTQDARGFRAYDPAALLFGEGGSCYAYSLLTMRYAALSGVDCRYAEGLTAGGRHAWNEILLDGKTFIFDASADVLHQSDYFFLLPEKDAGNFYTLTFRRSF